MSLSLLQAVAAVRARRASLSAETVGYLLLGVADQVIGVPREIGAADVALGEEGAVKVGVGMLADPERTERALRELLDALLSVASTATPALLRIGRRPASAGVEALVRELEAALIPVNRSAARRALTRLYRDTQRAVQAGPLDVSAAEAWLQRVVAPPTSVPTPAVVSEPSPIAVDPVPVTAAPCEVAFEIFEASPPAPVAVTSPLPEIEERPQVESLTRPEPVLVRAAARARADVREREADGGPPFVGTPRLGTFAMRQVLPPLVMPGDDVLLLNADEATERTPEAIVEPALPLVRTAPLFDVVTAPVANDELSADLASVVTDLVTESDEPSSPVAPAIQEPVAAPNVSEAVVEEAVAEEAVVEEAVAEEAVAEEAVAEELVAEPVPDQAAPQVGYAAEPAPAADAVDGDFVLDDEIVIVVDEDLEAFEPESLPSSEDDYPVTRWWSSPEPPSLTEPEPEPEPEPASFEPEEPAMAAESVVPELPSVPDLELPPLPEFVAWPTPVPPAEVAPTAETASAGTGTTEAEPRAESDFEPWGDSYDDAYLDLWESASNDEIWEPEPEDISDLTESEAESHGDADFEAAAAGYVALQGEDYVELAQPVAEPVHVERRVLPLPDAPDYAEVGWTPAPEQEPEPAQASLAQESPEPVPQPVADPVSAAALSPEPTPEPAQPRFASRRSDVSELLRGFAVTEARSDRELCRDLKALAGVDLTPLPRRIRSLG
jgi:hypothetical protein